MKTISMAKRFASILALMLAVMMLFAACGPDEATSNVSGDDQTATSSETIETSSEPGDVTETSAPTTNDKPSSSNPTNTTSG